MALSAERIAELYKLAVKTVKDAGDTSMGVPRSEGVEYLFDEMLDAEEALNRGRTVSPWTSTAEWLESLRTEEVPKSPEPKKYVRAKKHYIDSRSNHTGLIVGCLYEVVGCVTEKPNKPQIQVKCEDGVLRWFDEGLWFDASADNAESDADKAKIRDELLREALQADDDLGLDVELPGNLYLAIRGFLAERESP